MDIGYILEVYSVAPFPYIGKTVRYAISFAENVTCMDDPFLV